MSFQIRSEKKESEIKTIRFPASLAKDIENVISEHNISFSGFVIQACEYALAQMEEKM